ncbi:aminopeptidase P family N-terminal domain-containing protein [Gordonia sp. 852002-10350_SCH5691597]|uniref:aminopeptidase P family N-terminal domain-containing protein n=1 Tax=Gordonia sp. 852002-10350_SCH5691597 TaxID=1834085 RepID=UPI003FA597CC
MDLQGLSAIIVTDPANIFYLIGYNAWSFYTPQMLFVPIDGEMLFFAREMDAHGAHRHRWSRWLRASPPNTPCPPDA